MPGPGWSRSRLRRLRSPLRTTTVMMVGVARRSPAGTAAVLPLSDRTPQADRRGFERGREDRPSGGPSELALAGRLVPAGFPGSVSPRRTPLRPTGRPESVTVGSAEWVDSGWLTAESPLPRLRVPSGLRARLWARRPSWLTGSVVVTAKPPSPPGRLSPSPDPGRASKSGPDWSEPEPGRSPLTRSQLSGRAQGRRALRVSRGDSDTESRS